MARVAEGELEEHAAPGGPLEVRELTAAYNGMIAGLRQKRALERYVPLGARKEVAVRMSAAGIVAPRRERVVILFADLRGFSTLSEKSASAPSPLAISAWASACTWATSSSAPWGRESA